MITLDKKAWKNIFETNCYAYALGLTYQEIETTYQPKDNEWKIALFTTRAFYSDNVDLLEDYHFLRQHQNGDWYHKVGWYNFPTNKDNYGNPITDPRECYLSSQQYRKCLALTLKK